MGVAGFVAPKRPHVPPSRSVPGPFPPCLTVLRRVLLVRSCRVSHTMPFLKENRPALMMRAKNKNLRRMTRRTALKPGATPRDKDAAAGVGPKAGLTRSTSRYKAQAAAPPAPCTGSNPSEVMVYVVGRPHGGRDSVPSPTATASGYDSALPREREAHKADRKARRGPPAGPIVCDTGIYEGVSSRPRRWAMQSTAAQL